MNATPPNPDEVKNDEPTSTYNHETTNKPDHDISDDSVMEDITADINEPEKV